MELVNMSNCKPRYSALAGISLALTSFATFAAPIGGLVSTDRFGYSGTITRYNSQFEAENGVNPSETITITDRDLALFVSSNDPSISDWNVMMGSWWYTTDASGRAGFGNTRGNTGTGFLQLYDNDGSTDSSLSMMFGDFDGTYYTEFELNLEGSNAGSSDYARLSAYDNVNDGGIWHSYGLTLTASGLQGVETSPGIIESVVQPTGVAGSITGLFEITENQTSPDNQGFYSVDFNLSMTNWAWDNRDNLTGNYQFDDSTFRTVSAVPEPSMLGLLGVGGLIAFVGYRRRVRVGGDFSSQPLGASPA
jgi:hypothetical protein